jgi:hypothetical protein
MVLIGFNSDEVQIIQSGRKTNWLNLLIKIYTRTISSVKVSLQIRKAVLTLTPVSLSIITVVDGPDCNRPRCGSGSAVPRLICIQEVSGLRPGSGLAILTEVFVIVFCLSRQISCNTLKVDHDHFLPSSTIPNIWSFLRLIRHCALDIFPLNNLRNSQSLSV